MTEEWRPVVGWEGTYEVSSLGRVRSLDRQVTHPVSGNIQTYKGRNLRLLNTHGYRTVTLCEAPRRKSEFVHRLVAEAFIPNEARHPIVRHLNDLRDDNRVENLSWGTKSDNEYDKVRNGIHWNARKTCCSRGHEFTEENTRIDYKGYRQCKACDRVRKEFTKGTK